MPVSVFLSANDESLLSSGCVVDSKYGLTANPGLVLLDCKKPLTSQNLPPILDEILLELVVRSLQNAVDQNPHGLRIKFKVEE